MTRSSSVSSDTTTKSNNEATVLYTTASIAVSTTDLHTSAVQPTQRVSPSQTQRPVTGSVKPTDITDLQEDTATVGVTTSPSPTTTTTATTTLLTQPHSTPTRSTEVLTTTDTQTHRGTTELLVTTSPTVSTKTVLLPPPSELTTLVLSGPKV